LVLGERAVAPLTKTAAHARPAWHPAIEAVLAEIERAHGA
jgi:hypothetical protein